jgi:hypothetical protein
MGNFLKDKRKHCNTNEALLEKQKKRKKHAEEKAARLAEAEAKEQAKVLRGTSFVLN